MSANPVDVIVEGDGTSEIEANVTDFIANSLGVQGKEIARPKRFRSTVPATEDAFDQEADKNKREDFTEVRDNLKNVIAEVEMVVSDSVDEVRSNPSARMLESFASLVKTFADLNKDLLSIHDGSPSKKKSKKDDREVVNTTTNTTNNNLYVGDSDSLIDTIRKQISNE